MVKKKITLDVIAKKADVSIATVSRVLRQPNVTSITTQKRVREAIDKLKADTQLLFKPYQSSCRSNKILIIDNQLYPNSVFNRCIETELRFHGYQIFYFRFLNIAQQDIDQIIYYSVHYAFDGIIIINHASYLDRLIRYRHTLPPIVLVNHFSLDFPCVYFDHLMMSYNITRYLLENGHLRIAILLGDKRKMSATYLLEGYYQAMQRSNLSVDNQYIIENCFTYQHGKLAIKHLLESVFPPTAVIFADHLCMSCFDDIEKNKEMPFGDYHAVLGGIAQCRQMKVTIPQQLALFYFSHDQYNKYNELDKLSSVYKPVQKMGEKAVDILRSLLSDCHHDIKIASPIIGNPIFRTST